MYRRVAEETPHGPNYTQAFALVVDQDWGLRMDGFISRKQERQNTGRP